MYLRFTTTQIDQDSKVREGVFSAASSLLNSGELDKLEWQTLRDILDWFNEHLPVPPKKFAGGRAIFWFRSDAHENIEHIWELVHFLRAHDRHVLVHRCRLLGNVLYRDDFQVAAYPSEKDQPIRTH